MMTTSRVVTAVKSVSTDQRSHFGGPLAQVKVLAHAAGILLARSLAVLLMVMFAATSAQAEGDAGAGAEKAYTCMGCHGVKHYVNTYPTYHVPKLAGQHQTYLISALKAYRDGLRKHETMQANASSLTDQDIEDIAAFFANQKN